MERGGEIAWRLGELEDGAGGAEDHLRPFDYFDGLPNPVQCRRREDSARHSTGMIPTISYVEFYQNSIIVLQTGRI